MAKHDMRGLKNGQNPDVEEEQDQEESSFIKKAVALRNKLKLGPHYKMERFTVILSVTLVFLLLVSSMSFIRHRSEVSTVASTQAIYTDKFNFSLSGQQMLVEGIYGNKDKTDVMVLLHLPDPKGMSTDAKNYQLFITGEKDSVKNEPKASFSLFGSTGYGIVRFQNDTPIDRQVLSVTIRANSDLVDTTGTGTSGVEGDNDESFAEYDQGRFFVNPGADGVKQVKGLNANEKDPVKLYMALVADAKDKEIHATIKEQTDELARLLNRSQEYTNRLTSAGYKAPKAPWFIDGDYVDEKGDFKPASYLSRAFEFDYWSKDIHDGYINQVVGSMPEFEDYMKEHSDSSANVQDETKQEQVNRTEKLKHKDGSVLDLDSVSTDTSPSSQVAAKDAVDSLEQTWTQYLNAKSKLQRDTMRSLLILDADVQSQSSGYSVQNSKKAIRFY